MPDKLPISDECKSGGEAGECSVAETFGPHCRRVLEIGAGSEGNVSVALQRVLKDPTRHVAVESDKDACDNHRAMMDKRDLRHQLVCKSASQLQSSDVSSLGDSPDCIFADCEGCLVEFLDTPFGKEVIQNVKIFSNEMDGFLKGGTPEDNEHDNLLRNKLCDAKLCPYVLAYGCGDECDTEVWRRDTCDHVRQECKDNKRVFGCEYCRG